MGLSICYPFTISRAENSLQITLKVEINTVRNIQESTSPTLSTEGEYLLAFNDMQWREVEKDYLFVTRMIALKIQWSKKHIYW